MTNSAASRDLPTPALPEDREQLAGTLHERPAEGGTEQRQFALTSDHRRRGRPLDPTAHRQQPPGRHRLRLPFQLQRPNRRRIDRVSHQLHCCRPDQHLPRLRRLLEARCDVDRVAGRQALRRAGHDLAAVDADPPLQSQFQDRLPHLLGCAQRAQRIVFVCDRHPEDRHHRIPDELVDDAAMCFGDRLHLFEEERSKDRTASASATSPNAVEPTMSQNNTVTTLRCTRSAADANGAAQYGQKAKPSSLSFPQLAQTGTHLTLDLRHGDRNHAAAPLGPTALGPYRQPSREAHSRGATNATTCSASAVPNVRKRGGRWCVVVDNGREKAVDPDTGGWVFDDAEPRYTIVLASLVKAIESDVVPLHGPFTPEAFAARGAPVAVPTAAILELPELVIPLHAASVTASLRNRAAKWARQNVEGEDARAGP